MLNELTPEEMMIIIMKNRKTIKNLKDKVARRNGTIAICERKFNQMKAANDKLKADV